MMTIIRIIVIVSITLLSTGAMAQLPSPWGVTPVPLNGSVKVYDANDNFLGIAHDGGCGNSVSIFIPNLGVFATIEGMSDVGGKAHIRSFNQIYATADGMPYVLTSNLLQRLEDCSGTSDRYFVGSGHMVQKTLYTCWQECDFYVFDPPYSGVVSETYEVMEEDIPFPLPVATPLKFR